MKSYILKIGIISMLLGVFLACSDNDLKEKVNNFNERHIPFEINEGVEITKYELKNKELICTCVFEEDFYDIEFFENKKYELKINWLMTLQNNQDEYWKDLRTLLTKDSLDFTCIYQGNISNKQISFRISQSLMKIDFED